MGPQLNVVAVGATQISVGLSAIVAIRPVARQIADTLKIVAGSGTLWIAPIPTGFTGTAGASAMSNGYPLGSTEVFNIGGPATFYLSASGATMTVAVAIGYTDHVTLI